MAETVQIEHLQKGVKNILDNFAKSHAELMAKEMRDLPRQFVNEALKHYPSVLNVRTGRLRQSYEPVAKREGKDNWLVGLKSLVDYAAVHEFGFDGPVAVQAHTRKGHSVRAHSREMHVREKRIFRDPINTVADAFFVRVKKMIGFKK